MWVLNIILLLVSGGGTRNGELEKKRTLPVKV